MSLSCTFNINKFIKCNWNIHFYVLFYEIYIKNLYLHTITNGCVDLYIYIYYVYVFTLKSTYKFKTIFISCTFVYMKWKPITNTKFTVYFCVRVLLCLCTPSVPFNYIRFFLIARHASQCFYKYNSVNYFCDFLFLYKNITSKLQFRKEKF